MAEKKLLNAIDCTGRKGNLAFGLNEAKAARMLRDLAGDLEAGRVILHSVSTACHATQDEFTVREIVIELMEENSEEEPMAPPRPRIIKK
ncbi:MAG: hypothetical protein LAP21_16420 [Acidobacteriia bacterium]|nr:hypothetical protein [Terriglobia bacterium]